MFGFDVPNMMICQPDEMERNQESDKREWSKLMSLLVVFVFSFFSEKGPRLFSPTGGVFFSRENSKSVNKLCFCIPFYVR